MDVPSHSSPAARRYARALFEAALEHGVLAEISADVELIRHVTSHPEVGGWLADPRVEEVRKRELLNREIGSRTHALTRNLLGVVSRRRRHGLLPELPPAFERLQDMHEGRLRGIVASRAPLEDSVRTGLETSLSAHIGSRVLLEPRVDESLLGGVRVTLGGTRYDFSLRAQLERLRRSLAAAELAG
ncbi:MAG: ATP synthase F1 subunit delta [Planctomycetota bacterium]